MLRERLLQALEVLGEDQQAGHSLREQLHTYLGEEVDDDVLLFIQAAASATKREVDRNLIGQVKPRERGEVSNVVVFCAGMALGKRLGVEDGEQFARSIEVP